MNYTLKEIDDNLWKKFRIKCLQEGITVKAKLLQLIKEYVSKK